MKITPTDLDDPVLEATRRIEAANVVLAAALLGDPNVSLTLAAEHAVRMGERALRFLELAA